MKITVIGAGNAAIFTALNYAYSVKDDSSYEIELIHDPNISPEIVGQATFQSVPATLYQTLGFNWYNNPIHATPKSGILYEGFGKKNDKWFHPFPADNMAMHFCPSEMQKYILNSGYFKVIESNVLDPKDVDADYVFDCRGKPTDFTDYDELINPTNACILAKPNWDTTEAFWSRHVATPDGWTFVIPTHKDSPSHDYCVGYCYNSNITSKEDAEKNMLEMFDVEIKKHTGYKNYIAKNIVDGRIMLNGNRLFFLEPMESSAVEAYSQVSRRAHYSIFTNQFGNSRMVEEIRAFIQQTQHFILWHYQFGSKYDTPFWDYAKSLYFAEDPYFNDSFVERIKDATPIEEYGQREYGNWIGTSIKNWYDGMVDSD